MREKCNTETGRNRYVYRSLREGDRVRTEYVGTVESEEGAEYLQEREQRRREREQLALLCSLLDELDDVNSDLLQLEEQAMRERGYRKEDGKWKKQET